MIIIEDDVKKRIQLEFGYSEIEEKMYNFMKTRCTRIMKAHNTIHKEESMIHDVTEKLEKKAMDVELKSPVPGDTVSEISPQTQPLGLVPTSDNNGSQSDAVGLNGTLDSGIEEPLPPLVDEVNEKAYFNENPEVEKKDTEQQLNMYDNEIQM